MKSSHHEQIIGQSIIHLDSVESTNDYALKLIAKSNPINGTVISSDFQTHGKGQRDKNWQSIKKMNLLLSVILFPVYLTAGKQFYLSMMTSTALISFFETFFNRERLSIKWPNDIYIDDKKICGILIQNNIKGQTIDSTVIGIGINVNQKSFHPSLPNPTSLSSETDLDYDLEDLKSILFNHLNKQLFLLNHDSLSTLKENYESRLYKKGRISRISFKDGTIEGTILGVEPDGRLLVNAGGALKRLVH